jgi:alkanesulfonate monooxygenase SsuD/methylene tetrahydromethanopterin reductase-like flavin-dependent oxidoreductase (luciferase family)
MNHGLFVPAFDTLADPALLAHLAAQAEAAGWDGMFLWDHLLYADPVVEILDPWICLAAMAVATERIRLGPMVTPLSRRRPAVVARQAVTLDLLAQGRLILGFGLGDDGRTREMSRLGEEADPMVRAGQLDEGLEVLEALLSGVTVDHHGPHYVADGVSFRPPAPRSGKIPIWIGARWPNRAPLRRAARHDGVFAIQVGTPEALVRLRQVVTDAGARRDGFDVVVQGAPEDDPAPWEEAGATWWLTQLGPYHLELSEVGAVIQAGPRRG